VTRAARLVRLRQPPTTVRWRLTLLYGSLFLLSGAALLAITYGLVSHATVGGPAPGSGPRAVFTRPAHFLSVGEPPVVKGFDGVKLPPPVQRLVRQLLHSRNGRVAISFVGSNQRISDLHQLIIESIVALAIMAVLSTALGWLVAGRVLRPLRAMTTATREMSATSLHQRLAVAGPRDELRELADTIDGLLGRLEGVFNAQRRFVANASHELRTPLTAARALLEMALSDSHATVGTFRATCVQVLEESSQQEQLIDALLTLAQGQRGIERQEPVDLVSIAEAALQAREQDLVRRGLTLERSLAPVALSGDQRLIERLVSNLVDNAVRHNRPDGCVAVTVALRAGAAILTVANTGPEVPATEIGRLLQPFQRLSHDRAGESEGLGLGLSIVAAIADAHHAGLEIRPGASGGLTVEVRFRLAPAEVAASGAEAVLERST
jgi:signal transduction histidine kinase